MDEPLHLHNNNNVFILGAGFSAEAGIPGTRTFLTRMRDAAEGLDGNRVTQQDVAAITSVLKFRRAAAIAGERTNLDLENIEELFSLASIQGSTQEQDIARAIAATITYCADNGHPDPLNLRVHDSEDGNRVDTSQLPSWWKRPGPEYDDIEEDESTPLSIPPYEFYASLMAGKIICDGNTSQDTIITFNYDTLIESSLASLRIPINFGVDFTNNQSTYAISPSGTKLLKLHGSTNWTRDKDGLAIFDSYADLQERGLTPYLVPPSWQKSTFLVEPVWKAAVRALQQATRIIILGYSIPPTDNHFRYLLASGLSGNISLRKIYLINPDLEMTHLRLHAILRGTLEEQGILDPRHTTTRGFFCSSSHRDDICRNLIPHMLLPGNF